MTPTMARGAVCMRRHESIYHTVFLSDETDAAKNGPALQKQSIYLTLSVMLSISIDGVKKKVNVWRASL
jgi:hypothetical protein